MADLLPHKCGTHPPRRSYHVRKGSSCAMGQKAQVEPRYAVEGWLVWQDPQKFRSCHKPRGLWHIYGTYMAHDDFEACSPSRKGPLTCSFPRADDGIRTRDPHLGKVIRLPGHKGIMVSYQPVRAGCCHPVPRAAKP